VSRLRGTAPVGWRPWRLTAAGLAITLATALVTTLLLPR
jgi:hypothetical protein